MHTQNLVLTSTLTLYAGITTGAHAATTTTPTPTTTTATTRAMLVALNKQECDVTHGEIYLKSSSGVTSDFAACRKSCNEVPVCQSITYYSKSKYCSHFTTGCEITKRVDDAVSMRLHNHFDNNLECDVSKGEIYLEQSSNKASDFHACVKSCEDESECQSITFYENGWCSHFSTECLHKKAHDNCYATRVKKPTTTTTTTTTTT